ncbi:MAG TPA: hypothetical protein VFR91_00700 [Dyella sp.]|nr:hypothetical protein [Dyella sp.]
MNLNPFACFDHGPESEIYWPLFITETGEIRTFANREVRTSKNITLSRTHPQIPRDEDAGPGADTVGPLTFAAPSRTGALASSSRAPR